MFLCDKSMFYVDDKKQQQHMGKQLGSNSYKLVTLWSKPTKLFHANDTICKNKKYNGSCALTTNRSAYEVNFALHY